MSTGDLLRIEPQELQFPPELRKRISCSFRLSNETDNYVAFKVMSTNQKEYCVRPCTGIVLPRSTCDVNVTMDALKEAPGDMQCKDKFLVRSVTVSPGAVANDITPEMFNEEPGRNVKECKVMVVFEAPPRPPSRVREGSSPGASISVSRNTNNLEFTARKVPHSPPISPCDSTMRTGNLLRIEPQELQFPFELRKQISCSIQLSNKTDSYVAFKVKTTNPKKYCVGLNHGIVLPRSTFYVIVTMQAQEAAPLDMNCMDKFLLQSATASPGATAKDITREMFIEDWGRKVEECKMRVVYVAPLRPSSRVREGSPARGSISDGRNLNNLEFAASKVPRWPMISPCDSAMRIGDLLRIEPQVLQFPFELRKLISCSLRLSNETNNYVAFEVTTTNPTKYLVRPNPGIVLPRSTCDVKVTMQAQKEAPLDMDCKDRLLLQSATASPGVTAKDITREMFNDEPGRNVKECKLRVVSVAPPPPLSLVRRGFAPPASVPAIRSLNYLEFTAWKERTKREEGEAALRCDCGDIRSPKGTSNWNRVQTSPSTSYFLSLSLSFSLRFRSLSRRRSPQREVPPPPPICPSGSAMSTGDLLRIEPQELQFPFELRKQISCSLQLSNKTDSYVAFKVKTTNPKKYCVRPNTGIIRPGSTCDVIVTMQAQKEAPLDMNCKDKFLLQSVTASPGAATKDITPEMFNKESGHNVEECKLRVVYVPPPRPPSPVREGSEEGSSPRVSISDNGNSNNFEFTAASKTFAESQDNSSEANDLILKLTSEKNSAIQQNNKLQQELELLRQQTKRGHGGISFIYVVLLGLLGLILGYLMKST